MNDDIEIEVAPVEEVFKPKSPISNNENMIELVKEEPKLT